MRAGKIFEQDLSDSPLFEDCSCGSLGYRRGYVVVARPAPFDPIAYQHHSALVHCCCILLLLFITAAFSFYHTAYLSLIFLSAPRINQNASLANTKSLQQYYTYPSSVLARMVHR